MARLDLLHPAILAFLLLGTLAGAQVPRSQTFRFVNQGKLQTQNAEYDATYRPVVAESHNFFTHPFSLCFYNTTPDAGILAIGAGVPNDLSPVRWVWEANRNRPVKESALLSFRSDGNLVLLSEDGWPVWQTNTAGKGVTGIKLLADGNLVLHDAKGKFVWQSFDHPTDTLLIGQSLSVDGNRNVLVGRTSEADSSDGPYRMVLNRDGFTSYINRSGELLPYGGWRGSYIGSRLTFRAVAEFDGRTPSELVLSVNETQPGAQRRAGTGSPPRRLLQIPPTVDGSHIVLNKLTYGASRSFFRIGHDGNIRVYTYDDAVSSLRWRESFAYFSDYHVSECQLPEHCGGMGVCDGGMCVACPTARGMQGWSRGCAAPAAPGCGGGSGNATGEYYEIAGVNHFLSPFAEEGRKEEVRLGECRERCSKNCTCLGFIHNREESRCLLLPFIGTLTINHDPASVGYIKTTVPK